MTKTGKVVYVRSVPGKTFAVSYRFPAIVLLVLASLPAVETFLLFHITSFGSKIISARPWKQDASRRRDT
jgi:hypothetical protein